MADRQDKLAERLRENLKQRKAQQKNRKQSLLKVDIPEEIQDLTKRNHNDDIKPSDS